ncbi:MAG TPA: MarR family winged helix-turn-helix transcriptional regulator [Nitrospira sp.]|nr:MarR family winged helix-turn-helix transcriptional regulator [Nitrospira sp.]
MQNHESPPSPCYCAVLRKAARRVSSIYDTHLKSTGLKTSQFSLLAELSHDRPKPPTMNELSEYLVMDRSTLGHNLRPLLRQGLVLLKPDPDDGRTRRVILTSKGATKLSEGRRLWQTAQKEYEKMIGKGVAVELRNTLHNLTKLDVF